MRSGIVLLASFVLTLGAAAAADPAASPPADPLALAPATRCLADDPGASWSVEFAPGAVVEAQPSATASPPPCPVERDCTGPAGHGNTCATNSANCQVSGPATRIDTGNPQCTLPDGSTFTCPPYQTIHIKSAPCTHCRCCSTNPACLCPLDCGSVVRWGCG
jgi:hypothetical protein